LQVETGCYQGFETKPLNFRILLDIDIGPKNGISKERDEDEWIGNRGLLKRIQSLSPSAGSELSYDTQKKCLFLQSKWVGKKTWTVYDVANLRSHRLRRFSLLF